MLVTIVIPCYNHAKFVAKTIQSIIDQDYDNIELIVIDDGSPDTSQQVIESFRSACEARFKRFELRFNTNQGLSKTLNEGIAWAQGEYLSLIASDDWMYPSKTATQVGYLQHHADVAAVFTGVNMINDHDEILYSRVRADYLATFEQIFASQHDLPASTQMHRLNSLKAIGGFDENRIIEDWSMLLKLSATGAKIGYIGQPLVAYREHANNLSKRHMLMVQERFDIIQLYHHHPTFAFAQYKAYGALARAYRKQGQSLKAFGIKIYSLLRYYFKDS